MDSQLKQMNFTDEDFKMILEGLDAIPGKAVAGEMITDLLLTSLAPNKEEADKFRNELDKKRKTAQQGREILMENIDILKGKIVQFKRWLQAQNALEETEHIINTENTNKSS